MKIHEDKDMLALALHTLKVGEEAVVENVAGELSFISRISAIGFTRNAEITMLQNWKWGPVIVFIRDTQMALGRTEASRITVRKKAI